MSSGVDVEITRPIATALISGAGDETAAPEWGEIARVFRELSARDDVRCVVVRGVIGARSRAPSPQPVHEMDGAMDAALRAVRACKHPTVAVIEGLCTGPALELAACCDLRVCGESSRFGSPLERPARPERSSPTPLAALLGWGPLLDSLRGGEPIGAGRALASGLVTRVVPDGAVVSQGYGLAARVAAGALLVNPWHKRVVRRLGG